MIKLQFRRNKTLIITAKTNKHILKVSISLNLMQNNLTKNYSRRKIITARSFSSSVSKFWQTSPFFLPQNILKAVSCKKSEWHTGHRSALVSCSHTACNFTRRRSFFLYYPWNFLKLLGEVLFRNCGVGYYLCNKTCKKQLLLFGYLLILNL